MDSKNPEMVEVAKKLKKFLEENNVYIWYSNITELMYLDHRELGFESNSYLITSYDIPESEWNPE